MSFMSGGVDLTSGAFVQIGDLPSVVLTFSSSLHQEAKNIVAIVLSPPPLWSRRTDLSFTPGHEVDPRLGCRLLKLLAAFLIAGSTYHRAGIHIRSQPWRFLNVRVAPNRMTLTATR
jgi:hypothetical protein